LKRLGIGRQWVSHRLANGRLFKVHRGVYAVGHRALSREGRWMAAVLACGQGAVLSHGSAAKLWKLLKGDQNGVTHVTTPRALRGRPGIRAHHVGLTPEEVTSNRGIPVTSAPRTIFDLAASANPRVVRKAFQEAEFLRLTDAFALRELLLRYAGRRGAKTIRKIVDSSLAGWHVTRSELEERFLEFVEQTALPTPELNARLSVAGGLIEVDVVWKMARLVAELDGHAAHGTWRAYERDRARDRALAVAGWRVVRITWRQLHDAPAALARDLRSLLRFQPSRMQLHRREPA
jgi:very-short-patch-repair endonuclease